MAEQKPARPLPLAAFVHYPALQCFSFDAVNFRINYYFENGAQGERRNPSPRVALRMGDVDLTDFLYQVEC